ncbi:MAG: flagellar export protein FliJ [Nitrospiraceae bacterium]|nr:MAG: flagellar export protein FliJ [Nitrospiraceae bacterium]
MRKTKTINKILKLKDNRKKEIEIEVKKAADRADAEKIRLQALEKDFTDMLTFFNEKHAEGSLNAGNLVSCYDFFSRINGKINEQQQVHSQCVKELTSLKNTLVTAHKEKKVFEILNDRAVKNNNKERLDSEQKENDFYAISRRVR